MRKERSQTKPVTKSEKASKDEINTKTHNEDKKATRALIATILIISFFLILALIGIYSDESSPNYAENVTDTYNYYDDTIDSSLYKTNSIFTPMSTIDKNELSENKQEISIENIETKKSALEKNLTIGNSWESEGKSFAQFSLEIYNNSEETIKDWYVNLYATNIEITQIWNGKSTIENGILKITPEEYNMEIQSKQKIEVGFIANSSSKEDLNNMKCIDETSNEIQNDNKEENMKNTVQEESKEQKEEKSNGQTPVAKYGKLSVKGTNLVGSNGDVVQLKGVSTHSISVFPQYINKETFKEMRDSWNINVVRIAMYSNPNDGYKPELHNKVKEAVNYATDLGLYVIIDWHILQDNNPNTYKNEAIKFFEEMATEFKNNDNVLYEICNEPNGNVKWDKDIKPYAEEVITKIRAIDPDSVIIVGTPTWSQDVDIVANNPITDYENIMYTLHFYAATHKEDLRNKLKNAHEKGLPIFVTEFGISDASGNGTISESEGDKWIDLLNSYNISWVCWNLSNKNETSAILNSNCNKTTGFQESDFSQQGKWLLKKLK